MLSWLVRTKLCKRFTVFVRLYLVPQCGGLMYKVFSDREIHTLCFLYNYVLAFYMFVRACLSQLGGLMCKQRATVFVSQYLS